MSGCRQNSNSTTSASGLWCDEQLFGAYDTFEDAADAAIRNFGRGPYLIREVGAGPITLPPSLLCMPIYAE